MWNMVIRGLHFYHPFVCLIIVIYNLSYMEPYNTKTAQIRYYRSTLDLLYIVNTSYNLKIIRIFINDGLRYVYKNNKIYLSDKI